MKHERLGALELPRRLWLWCGLTAALATTMSGSLVPRPSLASTRGAAATSTIFATTVDYVVQFYPLWFTFYQGAQAVGNRLAGPDRMTPVFHAVVAPNDDTLYVSCFLDVTGQPLILTVPSTVATWSLLTMDYYGNAFDTGIPTGTAGTYALTRPGWNGALPPGVTRVTVPVNFSIWLFRADKYSPAGQNQIPQAELFRRSLHIAKLSDYLKNPLSGAASIVPVVLTATPFKVIADGLIANDAIRFLMQLQTAVGSARTPPLSPSSQALVDRFNFLFNATVRSRNGDPASRAEFIAGAQAAHAALVDHYHAHAGPTRWITFTDIAAWGDNFLDRAATTQYLQLSNTHSTAAYYHAFLDSDGAPLDGSTQPAYVLTFAEDQIPQAKRFWSLTAYTPESITLVDNPANKYLVARYTPGLQYNPDGSLTIVIAPGPPLGLPQANWLPAPRGPFNVVLRVYGPEGSVADDTYVPPGIAVLRRSGR